MNPDYIDKKQYQTTSLEVASDMFCFNKNGELVVKNQNSDKPQYKFKRTFFKSK